MSSQLLDLFLPVLACPFCGAQPLEPFSSSGAVGLKCGACERTTDIVDGVWHAMGKHRPARTAAQLSNVVPPTPQLYERVWRVRSLTLLSRRSFPNGEELAELVTALRPAPGRVMVDIGCSEGLYARSLAAAGSPVLAVDHSVAFLRRVQRRATDEHLPILPVRALAQHLPVVPGTLAGAAIGGSLNEIGDQQQCLDQAAITLLPGGQLFSMHLLRAQSTAGKLLQAVVGPAGITFPTLARTRELLENAGLQVQRVDVDGVVCRVTAVHP